MKALAWLVGGAGAAAVLLLSSCIAPGTPPSTPTDTSTDTPSPALLAGLRELQRSGFDIPGNDEAAPDAWPARIVHRQTGAVLLLIPAGEFQMGSPESEARRRRDEHQHLRKIRKPFYLGETEVTQEQWERVMGSNPSHFLGADNPVESVSWDDCQEFLSKAEGGLRLPSEAEWEYACRAGTTGPFSFGANITSAQVNYDGNFPYAGGSKGEFRRHPVPVKSLPPNAWGLHEMHGNVWEWCQDVYVKYPGTGTEEPIRGVGSRVRRGGCWGCLAELCRSGLRFRREPGGRFGHIGLRLAKSLPR